MNQLTMSGVLDSRLNRAEATSGEFVTALGVSVAVLSLSPLVLEWG